MARRFSRRSTRIKACELAAQCLQGQFMSGEIGPGKLMALTVFFETYIDLGADETERRMRLLKKKGPGKLHVIAGGKL